MDKTVKLGPIASGNDRPARVRADERGRSVWTDTVETGQFDLVTTAELRAVLETADDDTVRSIEEVAAGSQEGVLARDASTGLFRVLDENELQALLANDRSRQDDRSREAGRSREPAASPEPEDDSLSLVSTQALRRMIRPEPEEAAADPPDEPAGGGFDPYNSS